MPIPAPRRRPSMYWQGRSQAGAQTSPFANIGQKLLEAFGSSIGGMMSPEEMFKAESAPIRSAFGEARERTEERISALGGGGNIRAIARSEERLAKGESEALGTLKSQIGERSMSRQAMGFQILDMLKKLGLTGFSGAGQAFYGR